MTLALNLLLQLNGNKMKTLLIVFFVCLAFFSFEQTYAGIGEKGGEMYYIHKVESKNSLYSISVTYETSIEKLIKNNPELSEGLKIGQVIWIPVKYDDLIHIVRHRETLYGISKRYSKPIDSIVAHNPQLKDGLQKGQEIVIKNIIRPIKLEEANDNPFSTNPEIESTASHFEDSLVEYLVHSGETLYSISRRFMVSIDTLSNRNHLTSNVLSEGQILIIPLKKELEVKEREGQDTLGIATELFSDSVSFLEYDSIQKNVVVFLPFNLDTIDVRNIRGFAVDYYMGALLAIDSLKRHGVQCDFYFFDYESKIEPFDSILKSEELINSDLIFAPFDYAKAKKLKEWALDKTMKIVYSLKSLNKLHNYRLNDYFMEPEGRAKQYVLAKHLSKTDSCQLVFIKTSDSLDLINQNKFLEIYYNINAKTKLIEANETNYKFFANKKNTKTLYVLLSEDEDIVKDVLSFSSEKDDIMVYGKEQWLKKIKFTSSIENITPFRYSVGTYLDYKNPVVKSIHRSYRRRFNSDLTKMSGIGYDATLNIVLHLLYDVSLQKGLVHNFRFDFEGSPLNHNMGGYILNFDNLDISIVE